MGAVKIFLDWFNQNSSSSSSNVSSSSSSRSFIGKSKSSSTSSATKPGFDLDCVLFKTDFFFASGAIFFPVFFLGVFIRNQS